MEPPDHQDVVHRLGGDGPGRAVREDALDAGGQRRVEAALTQHLHEIVARELGGLGAGHAASDGAG